MLIKAAMRTLSSEPHLCQRYTSLVEGGNRLNFVFYFIFLLNFTYPKINYWGVAETTVVAGPDKIPPTWILRIITMLTRQ